MTSQANPPEAEAEVSDDFARGYCAAMAESDGSIHLVSGRQVGVTFRRAEAPVLLLTQKYLLQLRILSTLRGPYSQPDRHGMWSLVVHKPSEVLKFIRTMGYRRRG